MTSPARYIPFSTLLIVLLAANTVRSDEPRLITNSIDMKLARIPAGTFGMGSPRSESERDDKEELHDVTIGKPFYIGVYEVKQAEYIKVMDGVPDAKHRSAFKSDDNPVENVEWRLAKVFCEQLSARSAEKREGRKYRLPTEAEWEYACRAGSSTAFHFGDSIDSTQANFNGRYPLGNSRQGKYLRRTTKVGSYLPNDFGLYDMHGNVAEWCGDWYDPEYYLDSPDEDPLGPPFGVLPTKFTNFGDDNFFVVVRGGCWVDDEPARAVPHTATEPCQIPNTA